ncbi:MAG: hypothetical protein ACRDD4_06900 [Culicoidibacterales bacterium]
MRTTSREILQAQDERGGSCCKSTIVARRKQRNFLQKNNQVQNVKPNSKELTIDSSEPDTLVDNMR